MAGYLAKIKKQPLWWILPLFLFLRLSLLFYLEPNHFAAQDVREELYRGAVARDLVDGLAMPFMEYRPFDYAGGFYVFVFIAAAMFFLLGPTYFALKLTSLLFSLLSLLIWYFLLEKFVHKKVAVYVSLLSIFASFSYIKYTLSPIGDHPEMSLFYGAALYSFLSFREAPDKRIRELGAFGFISGLATWYDYTYAPLLFGVGCYMFFHWRTLASAKRVLYFLFSFLIGFSPWIYLNIKTGFAGLVIHGDPVWRMFNWDLFFARLLPSHGSILYDFFVGMLPTGVVFLTQQWVVRIMLTLWVGAFLVLFLVAFKRKKISEIRVSLPPAVTICLISLGFYLFLTHAAMGAVWHLTPAYSLFFVIYAYCVYLISDSNSIAFIHEKSGLFITALCVLGLLSLGSKLTYEHRGAVMTTRGYSYEFFSIMQSCPEDLYCQKKYEKIKKRLSFNERQRIVRSFAVTIGDDSFAEGASLDKMARNIKALETHLSEDIYRHLLYLFGREITMQEDLTELKSSVHEHGKIFSDYESVIRRGAFDGIYDRDEIDSKEMMQTLSRLKLDVEEKKLYFRVIGRKKVTQWYASGTMPSSLSESAQGIPEEHVTHYFEGVGAQLMNQWKETPVILDEELGQVETVSSPIQKALLRGVGLSLANSDSVVLSDFLEAQIYPHLRELTVASIEEGKMDFYFERTSGGSL